MGRSALLFCFSGSRPPAARFIGSVAVSTAATGRLGIRECPTGLALRRARWLRMAFCGAITAPLLTIIRTSMVSSVAFCTVSFVFILAVVYAVIRRKCRLGVGDGLCARWSR